MCVCDSCALVKNIKNPKTVQKEKKDKKKLAPKLPVHSTGSINRMNNRKENVYPNEFITELIKLLTDHKVLNDNITQAKSSSSTFFKDKVSVTPFHLTNDVSKFIDEYEAAIEAKLQTRKKRGDTIENMVLNIATWKIVTDKSTTIKARKAKIVCYNHTLSKHPIRIGIAEADYNSPGVQELIDSMS